MTTIVRPWSNADVPRYKLIPSYDRKRQRYCLNLPASIAASSKRERRFFQSRQAALKYAESVQSQLTQFGLSLQLLDPHQTTDAMAAIKLLADHATRTGSNHPTLRRLAEAYLQRWEEERCSKPLGELFEEYVQANRGRRTAKYLREITYTQRKLTALDRMLVCQITHRNLEACLAETTDFSFNAHLRHISAVLGYGCKKGYLASNPTGAIDRKHIPQREITLLPNSTIRALFSYAIESQPRLLAFLTLAIYCGVRTVRELPGLEWRDIDLHDKRVVCVRPEISKTRARRYIALSPNAIDFLWFYRRVALNGRPPASADKVLGIFSPEGLRKARRRLWKQIGERPPSGSVFRHCFASNHLALHDNVDALCREMGHNNPKITFQKYANGVTREDAKEFWSFSPPPVDWYYVRSGPSGVYPLALMPPDEQD